MHALNHKFSQQVEIIVEKKKEEVKDQTIPVSTAEALQSIQAPNDPDGKLPTYTALAERHVYECVSLIPYMTSSVAMAEKIAQIQFPKGEF